jgi:hypothetical protein
LQRQQANLDWSYARNLTRCSTGRSMLSLPALTIRFPCASSCDHSPG